MAYTQHIHLLLFFLALTACLEIQFAEGRKLKEPSTAKIERGLEKHAKQAVKSAQGLGNHEDNLQVDGQKTTLPPVTPTTQRHEFSSSNVFHKDSFPPTTPGNSPGVGHSFAERKDNMQPNEQHFTFAAGKTEGFQPTTPGRSPGVGHSIGNLKARPNA